MSSPPRACASGSLPGPCSQGASVNAHENTPTRSPLSAGISSASPEVKTTFDALRDALATIGPHAVVPVKTMILLRMAANFANVVVRRDCLHLEFVLRRQTSHERIRKGQPMGPGRCTHHIRLSSSADVDDESSAGYASRTKPSPGVTRTTAAGSHRGRTLDPTPKRAYS